MEIVQQIVFVVALAATGWYITKRIQLISRAIRLGRSENRTDHADERLKTMLLVAFGQKKMFNNPLVGVMHFVIYAGFLIVNIEVLEIILDGVLGTHRLFAPFIAPVYPFLIGVFEILAVGVLTVCVVFLCRRFIVKVSRFQPERHREMTRWPRTDAAVILIAEILLMIAFLTWNASDSVLRDRGVGHYAALQGIVPDFLISQYLKPLFINFSDTALIGYERSAWWFHILGIMAFAVYVTYSKHLHIALGFPNVYFSDLKPKGEIQNMPEITKEVQLSLGLPVTTGTDSSQTDDNGQQPAEIGRFGAKDVQDLKWINLMNAYSCTECGRCTAACPANITGKKLSPRKIMMDTRDRLEEIQQGWKTNGYDYKDDKSLLNDYITAEELNACTTCQACVNACPININPLDIILQLRRYRVMEESQAPASWNAMFSNIENNMAPWKFSPSDRFNWADQVNEVK
ncbi:MULTISPECIES: 4Fe-4S dicluster domain-containing protein [unclassified Spirosoma]|uniref:4Fe-4S dicluster domain-containing protein n=1 Tax=unclassified Spirosoma TaxID=2621999 RepID=UPI000963AB57|nr:MULTISPECIES: 4Fe-4S dicluster domain-containing protein [unclassified Spirosoma]MBN8825066.1 4Fe-4S dicluster domain-containing protein [Spirosoma sp.]OJW73354.1 MAG: Fe-S oxidoreductase [Spirosoma sp. 48-14]